MKTLCTILFTAFISFTAFSQETCFMVNDLNNTGYFYHGNINVNGNNVSGKITKEDQAGVGYEMTYTGTKSGNNLTVSVTYSNDATSPFIEQWVLDASGLKIANPVILVPVTVCK